MNRLTKTTASAMLLMLMAATPAWAIAYDEAVSSPVEPGVVRILAAPAEPVAVLMESRPITFDQKPAMVDGTLMVPLRAVVEGAGGHVGWDGETKTVTVRLGDRSAVFVIGAPEAELNQDGVFYVQRNLIPMAKAPVLMGGRTLVAADALTGVLGLLEQPGATGTLNLVRATPEWVVSGTVKELKTNQDGTTAILVEGAPMASGETSLTWFAVTDSTQITVEEGGVQRKGTTADLAAAQKVGVRPTGPLLMSYPARGGAASILIRK